MIDSNEISAFALPGGFFYVNSGLILTADTEAELAGVMAHEIAHVAARHATRQMTRFQLANIASIPLIFVGGAKRRPLPHDEPQSRGRGGRIDSMAEESQFELSVEVLRDRLWILAP